jgi:programmed cell death protein 5
MDNFGPSNVKPEDLPDGVTAANPNSPSSVGANSEAEFKKQAIREQKQMILDQAIDSEALARLGRIKMVKPNRVASVENTIVRMAVQGKLPGKSQKQS